MGIERAATIARMSKAIRDGLSVSGFISQEKRAKRLTYRRSDMLADWRSKSNVAKKEGLLRFVRKDRYPTNVQIAKAWPNMSKEYMYQVRVENRLRPDEPITKHLVNIMSDIPLTPAMVEQMAIEERAREEKYLGEVLIGVQAWSVIRRVPE